MDHSTKTVRHPKETVTEAANGVTSIRSQVSKGAIWTVVAAAGNKVFTLGGQLVLAWLLLPEDFGVAALAASFASAASIFSAASLKTILIQRQKQLEQLLPNVFWLGFALHAMAGAALFLIAPLAGRLFDSPEVPDLVRIIALSFPLTALPMVNWARLQIDLRFGLVAGIQTGQGIIQTLSTVALALAGFGPYSFVLPRLWTPIYELAATRLAAGPSSYRPIQIGRWRDLISASIWISLFGLFQGLTGHSTNFVLGLFQTSSVIGVYFWGYQVASQVLHLISSNLVQVFFPAFARLKSERNHFAGPLREVMSAGLWATALICALQVVAAPRLIDLFLPNRWAAAGPVVQYLTAGLILVPLGAAATSSFLATGSFRLLSFISATQVGLAVAAAAAGSILGEAKEVAACVAIATLVGHLLSGLVATHLAGIRSSVVVNAVLKQWVVAGSSAAVGEILARSTVLLGDLTSILFASLSILLVWFLTTLACDPSLRRLVRRAQPIANSTKP